MSIHFTELNSSDLSISVTFNLPWHISRSFLPFSVQTAMSVLPKSPALSMPQGSAKVRSAPPQKDWDTFGSQVLATAVFHKVELPQFPTSLSCHRFLPVLASFRHGTLLEPHFYRLEKDLFFLPKNKSILNFFVVCKIEQFYIVAHISFLESIQQQEADKWYL